jgi:hypothetical protein
MSTVKIREEIYSRLKAYADRQQVPVESFVEASLKDRITQLEEWERLKQRLPKPSREAFDRALAKVPSRPPMKGDELPAKKGPTAKSKSAAAKGKRRLTA